MYAMYVNMQVFMYVGLSVCLPVGLYFCHLLSVCMCCVCLCVCVCQCMYVCMHACMHASTCVCVNLCMCVFVCACNPIYRQFWHACSLSSSRTQTFQKMQKQYMITESHESSKGQNGSERSVWATYQPAERFWNYFVLCAERFRTVPFSSEIL